MNNILITVTNKTGLEKFKQLRSDDWRIISTGGTLRRLQEHEIPCISVEDITGFPEMMDGRLKTLHPKIHGGILADRGKHEHVDKANEHNIPLIDVAVVNLYQFWKKPGIESIDIGGPALIRGAAKNGAWVTVIVDPKDYDMLIAQLAEDGGTSLSFRERMAQKAFNYVAQYDHAIADWMREQNSNTDGVFS